MFIELSTLLLITTTKQIIHTHHLDARDNETRLEIFFNEMEGETPVPKRSHQAKLIIHLRGPNFLGPDCNVAKISNYHHHL
jgi:hypothetical protein